MQQRIAALTSIAGLLSIHQQGFYDTVLDVPVSKIFFLLRFAFDDNHVAAILEVTARALAALFHNDADEVRMFNSALLRIFFIILLRIVNNKSLSRSCSTLCEIVRQISTSPSSVWIRRP